MQFAESVFRSYDIRGLWKSEITPDLAFAVGRAMADFLDAGPVAVGYDMRNGSKELSEKARQGLANQGREVWDIGMVTVDMLNFTVGHYGLAGGIMVTASHNPAEYNGLKLCREVARAIGLGSGLEKIKQAVERGKFKPVLKSGRVKTVAIFEDWRQFVLSYVEIAALKPLKVVIDAGNGMAGMVFSKLAPDLPIEIVPLYFELDGNFPNRSPNPTHPENLKALIAKVNQTKADLGLAFDGDSDRMVLVDETGQLVLPSLLASLLVEVVLGKHAEGTVVYDLTLSHLVPETIQALGGKAVRSPIGHPSISKSMRQHNAVLGLEEAGHFYYQHNYYTDSAIISALLLLEEVSRRGQKLTDLFRTFRPVYHSGEINFKATDSRAILNRVEKHFQTGKTDHLDGLTINFDDWWFNLRPSNTEPLLRLNVEAKSAQQLKTKVDELTNVINA